MASYDRWTPRTKASEAELWCFLWSASDWRWFETLSCPLWRQWNYMKVIGPWLSYCIIITSCSISVSMNYIWWRRVIIIPKMSACKGSTFHRIVILLKTDLPMQNKHCQYRFHHTCPISSVLEIKWHFYHFSKRDGTSDWNLPCEKTYSTQAVPWLIVLCAISSNGLVLLSGNIPV